MLPTLSKENDIPGPFNVSYYMILRTHFECMTCKLADFFSNGTSSETFLLNGRVIAQQFLIVYH